MRVWNVNETQALITVKGMCIKYNRLDSDSVATNVTLRPETSFSVYSRMSTPGLGSQRHGPWLCWHGFKRFIEEMFSCWGATRVKSVYGDWRSLEEFTNDLPRMSEINVGSIMYPWYLSDSDCEC